MTEMETLLKLESNISAMKVLIKRMLTDVTLDDLSDFRSLTSRNLELIGGDVCDLCGDPTKSTTVCWHCWHLEYEEEIIE